MELGLKINTEKSKIMVFRKLAFYNSVPDDKQSNTRYVKQEYK